MVSETVQLQRNPTLNRAQMEQKLKGVFHAKKIVWLKSGLADDMHPFLGKLPGGILPSPATGGHIDEYARFVSDNTILLAQVIPEERDHPIGSISHKNMEENYQILLKERDQDGNPFDIVRIPLPPSIYQKVTPSDGLYEFYKNLKYEDGTIIDGPFDTVIAASYCNFLISNGVVLIPKYYKQGRSELFKQTDQQAKDIIQKVFPSREVVQVDVESLNIGGGGMHCISQQEFL